MIDIITQEVKDHISNIGDILDRIGERVEGNLICDITSDNLTDVANESKIYNLLKLSENKSKICEIGVNAGHSLLLMVSANPEAEYLIFDLGGHVYTRPCVQYIKNAYPSTKITEVYGDSNITLKKYIESNELHTFDLIHIDGGHETATVENDFTCTQELLTKDGVVVFDDYNFGNIRTVIDSYVDKGVISEYTEDVVKTDLHFIYKLNDRK
jgi:predicted O-methyltransferase YrrM